jgi:hypothetical protein
MLAVMSQDASPVPPGAGSAPLKVDPKSILFSLSTISSDLPPLEKVERAPQASDFIIDEDYWSQVEFFPKSRLEEVERMLNEFKPFEIANRVQHAWRKIYVREIARHPVLAGPKQLDRLSSILGIKAGPAPIVVSSNTIRGRVSKGFIIPLGGKVTLYGYETPDGIAVLGAAVGQNPDDRKLVGAFAKLSAGEGLMLVDWRQQLLLTSVGTDGKIDAWRP